MRVDLDSEQINFLNEKFGIKSEDIKKMNLEEWDNVRLKCFEIETDEMCGYKEKGGEYDDCDTEDFLIASSIIDLPYAM